MRIKALLLDIEGVLVADKRYRAVPTAVDFVARARAAGVPLRLISNNTTDPREQLHEKLRGAGFDFALEELHTCTSAAVKHLEKIGARRCLVLANAAIRQLFVDAGLEVVEAPEVDAVVVGLDTELTFARLQMACEATVAHGAKLVALHRNRLYTDAQGRPAPSVGALVAAVTYATQVEPTVIGKPSAAYFRQALDELGVPPGDVLLVSDDPLSDLAGGKQIGVRTAFVLSGKYANERVLASLAGDERPDLVVGRIGDLLDAGGVELVGG